MDMHTGRRFSPGAAGLIGLAVIVSECSGPASSSKPAPAAASTASALLGDMKPVVSVKELMQYVIDPAADQIFEAVSYYSGTQGEHAPRTQEDWENVRSGAIGLAEAIYLLKVPRPFAPPGDLNASTGPNAPELSPTQIKE